MWVGSFKNHFHNISVSADKNAFIINSNERNALPYPTIPSFPSSMHKHKNYLALKVSKGIESISTSSDANNLILDKIER